VYGWLLVATIAKLQLWSAGVVRSTLGTANCTNAGKGSIVGSIKMMSHSKNMQFCDSHPNEACKSSDGNDDMVPCLHDIVPLAALHLRYHVQSAFHSVVPSFCESFQVH
jgi:hypothetical protein